MRRFVFMLFALSLSIGTLSVFASSAQADEETKTAVATATSVGNIDADTLVSAVTVVNTNASGKIVGSWFKNPNHIGKSGHWKPSKALKVPFAKSYNAGAASCEPFRLKKGKWYPHTLKMRDGTRFQVKGGTHVDTPWRLFDVAGKCQIRQRGYWTGSKWIGDCVNPKPGSDWPVIPPSMVVEVKQFNKMRYALNVDWIASAMVSGTVEVNCEGSWAKSSFNVEGRTSGSIKINVTAKSVAEAKAKGAKQVKISVESDLSVKSKIEVNGEVLTEGSAEASCGGGTVIVTPPPSLLEASTINDVLLNNTRTITVTGTVAPGHSATLFATAKNGGTITVGKLQSVSGSFTATITYKAPSEVPGANNGVSAGHDRVDFTLTQDDGKSDSISTNEFVIKAPLPDPL